MLDLFGIILSAFAEFFHPRGAPIDFVFDFLTFFVAYNGTPRYAPCTRNASCFPSLPDVHPGRVVSLYSSLRKVLL